MAESSTQPVVPSLAGYLSADEICISSLGGIVPRTAEKCALRLAGYDFGRSLTLGLGATRVPSFEPAVCVGPNRLTLVIGATIVPSFETSQHACSCALPIVVRTCTKSNYAYCTQD